MDECLVLAHLPLGCETSLLVQGQGTGGVVLVAAVLFADPGLVACFQFVVLLVRFLVSLGCGGEVVARVDVEVEFGAFAVLVIGDLFFFQLLVFE